MKLKILVVSCILILSFGKSHAAFTRDTIPVSTQNALVGYEELMKKSHRQLTTGAILLWGGAAVTIAGSYMMLHELTSLFTSYGKDNSNTAEAVTYVGLGLMLLSIPFNLSGTINKRRAKLFMRKETTSTYSGIKANPSMTTVGVRINF